MTFDLERCKRDITEHGVHYARNRDGDKVALYCIVPDLCDGDYHVLGANDQTWKKDGSYSGNGEDPSDLIGPWEEEPEVEVETLHSAMQKDRIEGGWFVVCEYLFKKLKALEVRFEDTQKVDGAIKPTISRAAEFIEKVLLPKLKGNKTLNGNDINKFIESKRWEWADD